MNRDGTRGADPAPTPLPDAFSAAHPKQLGISDFSSYAMIIDARTPREFAEDHIPGAVNLPVVDNDQYAEVGIKHVTDKHAAYLIGVEYSLRNIARYIKPLISKYTTRDRFLVYCFRGGKRSRLWADNLRTIGFDVDVLTGGWRRYRNWVREGLVSLPRAFSYRVLCGPTGCGKTRLLLELQRQGHQTLDLEALASHRGSLLGTIPDERQPPQKMFDSLLLNAFRAFDPHRSVWLEAESKKIGNLQIPEALFSAMHASPVVNVTAPMPERVRLWREDYPHFATDPVQMVRTLEPLKPLVGKETLNEWMALAAAGRVDELFESVMVRHYDPCYVRSIRHNYGSKGAAAPLELTSLHATGLADVVRDIAKRHF